MLGLWRVSPYGRSVWVYGVSDSESGGVLYWMDVESEVRCIVRV